MNDDNEKPVMVTVPLERTYTMRSRAIIAFNTARDAGKDHDDCLDAAWKAMVSETAWLAMVSGK